MDNLPDNAWANGFQSAPTRPVLTALQHRLQASTTHVHALAELFRERAIIEHEYASKLGKLVRSAEAGQLSGKGATEWDRHSGEAKLWETVLGDIQETASTHMSLSTTLKSDFEQPVRDMPNKIVPWRHIHDQEVSLDRTLKDAEKTASKLDKASMKKSAKADQLASDLNQLNSTLASLAPKVFTTFQRLDEERLRSLKEVVVRWATSRADIATKDGQRAEASLTKLLSWETTEEVGAVGERIASASGGGRTAATSGPGSSTGHLPQMPTTPVRRPSAQTTGSSSDLTPRSSSKPNGSSHATGGGGFSGFKSMLARKATVSGRQRSGSEATSMRSTRRAPTDEVFAPLDERDDEVEPARLTEHAQHQPSGHRSENQPPTKSSTVDDEGFSIAPADRHRNPWDEPNEDIPTTAPSGVALPSAIMAGQRSTSPDTSRPSSAAGSVETSGHSRLNLALASTPILESEEERSAALAKMQQTLQAVPGAPVRRTTIARGRREARNAMQTDNNTALPNVTAFATVGDDNEREQLSDQPQGNVPSHPSVRRTSVSSMASSRNPFDSPSMQGQPTLAGIPAGQAISPAGVAAAPSAAPLMPGVTSHIPGAESTGIIAPASSEVAAPSSTALQASIVETVHALIHQFASLRTAITGEIRLSCTPATLGQSTVPQPVHIRLTGFDMLESIAPNPTFLAQVPDQPGEYYLNLDVLSQATASQESSQDGPVLFKYHVLVPEESQTAIIPLGLNPAFQVREGETRMILHYRSTPNVIVSNLRLQATFPEEPSITATQSKPVSGNWIPSTDSSPGRHICWEPAPLAPGEDAKVVARFVTHSGAPNLSPISVNARFTIPDHLLSGLGIEVVHSDKSEGSTSSFSKVSCATVSGKYVGDVTLNP